MRAWIISDLHVELTEGWEIPGPSERPLFDIMIVAGDLIPRMERGVRWLIERVDDRPVIYIAGNHEAYGTDIDRFLEKAREAAAGTNIIVMENDVVDIGGVRIIDCTLWTDFGLYGDPHGAMALAGERMNDYRRIRHMNYERRLRPIDTLARHRRSRAFIEEQLARPFAGKRVVVTHHAPYFGGLASGTEKDPLSAAYASDLVPLIESCGPDVWIYGHTHRSDDTLLGRTRVLSNAKGYGPGLGASTWDNPMFDPKFTVEI
jgi:3',5'-cyclic AMP phosphodiesterase CpdA